jgi:hypothetical protein
MDNCSSMTSTSIVKNVCENKVLFVLGIGLQKLVCAVKNKILKSRSNFIKNK